MDGTKTSSFDPLSIANITSSVITVSGLILLGIMTYTIAKKKSDTKTKRTADWHTDMNVKFSLAYLGAILIAIGFGVGHVFD